MTITLDYEPVCSLCGMPAVQISGQWLHAQFADAVFCTMVMRGIPLGGNGDEVTSDA